METVRFKMDDGVELAADIRGPKGSPAIVLAHGGGQTRHAWAGANRALSNAGYRTINYDARGHGESDWSADNRYPIERRWADMHAISTSAGLPHALVGASMGGAAALYGLMQGARPDAVVLVDIAPNASAAGMKRVRDFMAAGIDGYASLEEAADAVAAYNPARQRPKDPGGLRKNLRPGINGRWYWHWDPGMLEIEIEAERRMLLSTFSVLKQLPEIPMLMVRGLQSDVVPEEAAESFAVQLPWVHVETIGGAGHMVAGDRNDTFQAAIVKFLTECMPPGGRE